MSKFLYHILVLTSLVFPNLCVNAQEIDARITVNAKQIQGTSTSVFENLEQTLKDFINDRQWTNLQISRNERITCTFGLMVTKYDESAHSFECRLNFSMQRPVFGTSYTTTTFATTDDNFNFEFQEFDKLEFRPDVLDKDLTALIAYYVYLAIGIDLDTFSPMGGTEQLQMAQTICNSAQSLQYSFKGWKPFDDGKNRFGIINDYLDNGLSDFRQMQYKYHREGLDIMAENPDRGRAAITESFELLEKAHTNKSMSLVPQIFTDYKRDEIVNIYNGEGHGTQKEKQTVYELLSKINASQNTHWQKIISNR